MLWVCTDWKVDWSAVSAVLAGGSALVAAWAAWEARGAAKTALRIDQQVAERAVERERRDAIPLAIAIQRELFEIHGLMHGLPRMIHAPGNSLPSSMILRGVVQLQSRFEPRVLEGSIRDLGCFDAEIGRALALALAATQAFRGVLDVSSDGEADSFCYRVLKVIEVESQRYSPIVRAGAEALQLLTGAALPELQP